jgi:C4-dicarboxylate-specific signal transduction histidine kinase
MKNNGFDSKIDSAEERLGFSSLTEITDSIQFNLPSQTISKLTRELNQSLTTMQAYIGGCTSHSQNKISMDEILVLMQKVVESTELLVSKLNAVTDLIFQEQLMQEKSDIHSIIEEVILMHSHKINQAKIAILFDFSQNLPKLKVNQSQLVLVLFNLIQFCIEAVKKCKAGKPRFEFQTEKSNENTIILTVRNNIPLFTPKFANRQKELEEKLSLYRAVLEREGGSLSMTSLEDSSWFQLSLHHKNDC